MKKWFLAILLLVCLRGINAQTKGPLPTINHGRIHSFESENPPLHQLIIPEFNFATGHHNRQQNTDGCFDYRSTPGLDCQYGDFQNNTCKKDPGPKYYLLHIYPSHNFW